MVGDWIITRALKASWTRVKDKWPRLIVPLAVDLLFLLLFGAVLTYFQFQMGQNLAEMETFLQTGPDLSGQMMTQDSIGTVLAQQTGFNSLTSAIISLTVEFFIIAYIIYTIFQSFSWYWNYRTTKGKTGYWSYVGQFAYLNLFWLVVAIGIAYSALKITLWNKLSLYPLISDTTGLVVLIGTIIFTAYFMLISYGLIGQHDWKTVLLETFKKGFGKGYVFLGVDAVFVFFVIVANYILKWAFTIDYKFMMVLGIIVFMPILSWMRILQIESVKEIK